MDAYSKRPESQYREDLLPLCVDLDGTLLRSDVLLESIVALLRHKPLTSLRVLLWLIRGRARFKEAVAENGDLNVTHLPYRTELVDYLREEQAKGRYTVLATASNEKLANEIAAYLDCFDEVIASNSAQNLKGRTKARTLVERFGERGFEYVGDSMADIPVWQQAAGGLIVGASQRTQRAAGGIATVAPFSGDNRRPLASALRAMRPPQWLKNLLVFVPLFAAHQANPLSLFSAALAFASFSLVASAAYLLNDILDLEADRSHPSKRNRVFAAGELHLSTAAWLIPALTACGAGFALLLPSFFSACLLLYVVLTISYSLYLKRIAVVDVMTLAGLYTLRIMAGGAAVAVAISFWLLAFSMFLFFSLALVKRTTEMLLSRETNHDLSRRGYGVADAEQLRSMGIASGYLAVLVVALYINSDSVAALYSEPRVLWLLCPVLLYWISRVWLKTGRGEMLDDPLVFTVKDRASRILAVISILILFGAL